MRDLRFYICCSICLLFGAQMANAAMEEPKPVHAQLYVTVYEQTVLLEAIKTSQADPFQLFLANAVGMDKNKESLFRAEIEDYTSKMQQKQAKIGSEKAFAKQLFYQVHRKFLRNYEPLQNFSSLLRNGTYNCLTATALYALLLDELGISYQIYETDYHIFLLVEMTDGEQVLFEATDPLHGFVEGEEEISRRINEIRKDENSLEGASTTEKSYFDFDLKLMRPINLQQLAGLQYYNQAAYFYNTKRIEQSALALSKGRLLYQADRFDKLASVLIAIR